MRQSHFLADFRTQIFKIFWGRIPPDPLKNSDPRVEFHETPIIWFGTSIPNSVDNTAPYGNAYDEVPIIKGRNIDLKRSRYSALNNGFHCVCNNRLFDLKEV